MLCKGAETAILEKTRNGPTDVTLSHINCYAEVGMIDIMIGNIFKDILNDT